ncbi:hypothetical protein [Paraburkholderia ginsengisoli]|uniref:Uncharacterized protein n=1 Tax=Paraburkholderia ginsengisoli TaxID=311231 RepID=A0A7T4TCS5_9BURK|nr:hypothetical protein [Paraburkholderia ginsengisoli]QQC67878.1 hypothetical protein I6I06_29115 [Paraburkholderia ginsengisoli]
MKPLSERAKKRLRIAAGLLRKQGVRFAKDGDFYGLVMKAIESHAAKDQLRELVDWVEAYDAASDSEKPSGGSRPRGEAPRS